MIHKLPAHTKFLIYLVTYTPPHGKLQITRVNYYYCARVLRYVSRARGDTISLCFRSLVSTYNMQLCTLNTQHSVDF